MATHRTYPPAGHQDDPLEQNQIVADLKQAAAAVWRYKAWVIWTTIVCVIAGAAFIITANPLYRGTNQLFIDPRSKGLVDNEIVPTGLGRSSIGGDLILLDSQVEIIRSDTILRRVLEQEKADGLAPPPKPDGLVKSLSKLFASPTLTDSESDSDYETLRAFRKALWVTRLSNSYVIGINVRDESPERAARLANLIAESYIATQNDARSNTTKDTTTTLNRRVDELRNRVRRAEAAVETYRAESGLIGADGTLIDDQQLRDLNNRVVAAKAETSVARARYEALQNASVSDVLAGSSTEALSSQVVSNLRLQLANITRREADALARFGERHPSLVALRAERDGVNTLLAQELQRIIKSAQNNLDVAQSNEAFVQSQFEDLTRASIDNKQALVTLRELEREAASSRSVLEEFLVKAKQSGEQEDLSNDSTRIISPAAVPTISFFPKKKLIMAASLFAGLSIGTLLAWLRALFSNPVAQTAARPNPRRAPHAMHPAQAPVAARKVNAAEPTEPSYPPQEAAVTPPHIESADAAEAYSGAVQEQDQPSVPLSAPLSHDRNGKWLEKMREAIRLEEPHRAEDAPYAFKSRARSSLPTHQTNQETPSPRRAEREEQALSRPASELTNAINALLPKSAERITQDIQRNRPLPSMPPSYSESHETVLSAPAVSHPDHLIAPVTDTLGVGGHVMGGDVPEHMVAPVETEAHARTTPHPATPAQPSTLSQPVQPVGYKRSPARDLLRRLRR
ncbi:MAG: GNVR domain-containing protein [Pseudomonadota bacterium]